MIIKKNQPLKFCFEMHFSAVKTDRFDTDESYYLKKRHILFLCKFRFKTKLRYLPKTKQMSFKQSLISKDFFFLY